MYGTFTNVDEYCLDMIPFENDLLSMEMEDSFKVSGNIFPMGDYSLLSNVLWLITDNKFGRFFN